MEELAAFFIQIFRQGFPCLFKLLTGLYYSGCVGGGTRAVRALLQGDIFLSIQYHSLVFYAAVVIGAELVSRVISRAAKNPRLYLGHEAFFIYTATDLVLANWLFKNYMLAVRGIDLLPAFG